MKKNHFTPALLTMMVMVSACSTTPKTTSQLEQSRHDYAVAQSNPKVANFAALEMKQATEALGVANAAAQNRDDTQKIDQFAYVAGQKIALAQEVAKQKSAEADIASAGKERDQVRLDQRTNEANQANRAAQVAQDDAARSQRNMLAAQQQTQDAQAHAAQLEAQLNALAAKKTERGMVITLGDVLFGTDMSQLTPMGMQTARKLADVLQQNPERTVLIEGFTDSTGSADHNQQLSQRRATAVKTALLQMNVAAERIAMRGYGEAFPVAGNATAQDRQLNRRVEIIMSDASGKIPQR
ncbi:MAG: OmpA family protein [Burkholderiaceae bacterium]|nr:OmpA family protein [Burkholderiaceae bacterium]